MAVPECSALYTMYTNTAPFTPTQRRIHQHSATSQLIAPYPQHSTISRIQRFHGDFDAANTRTGAS